MLHTPADAMKKIKGLGPAKRADIVAVQELAGHLEQALKNGEMFEALQPQLEAFQRRLDPLVAAIAEQLANKASSAHATVNSPGAVVDEVQLAEVTQRLRQLLSEFDFEASDCLELHHGLLHTAYLQQFPALLAAVKTFDFDVAVERLDAAVSARAGTN